MIENRADDAYHPVHESNKAPECHCIILLNSVNRRKKVAHTLDVTQITVIFVIGEEHIFHLFEMDIRTDLGKGRVCVRMWNVFSLK